MATKTKATSRTLDNDAEIHKQMAETALTIAEAKSLCSNAIYELHFGTPEKAADLVRTAKKTLSRAASHLRDLQKAQVNRRSPSRRQRAKPAKRKDVDGTLQNRPSVDSRSSKTRVRKRVPRKQAYSFLRSNDIKNLPY